jgi:L-threonylcarbamoyladenylate synthase
MTDDLHKALEILINGGTILYPTDTIWGIGSDATNETSVEKIYKIKNRIDSKSMLVLVSNFEMIRNYVETIPFIAMEIIRKETKPVTIIYPGAKNLASNLIAEDGSIGIRIVKDEFCSSLISEFKKPVVSTSANISGEPAPVNFKEIAPVITEKVDYIVKWRQNDYSSKTPSSIIKVNIDGTFVTIRK